MAKLHSACARTCAFRLACAIRKTRRGAMAPSSSMTEPRLRSATSRCRPARRRPGARPTTTPASNGICGRIWCSTRRLTAATRPAASPRSRLTGLRTCAASKWVRRAVSWTSGCRSTGLRSTTTTAGSRSARTWCATTGLRVFSSSTQARRESTAPRGSW